MTEEHPEMIALKKKISTLEQQLQTAICPERQQPEKTAESRSGKKFNFL